MKPSLNDAGEAKQQHVQYRCKGCDSGNFEQAHGSDSMQEWHCVNLGAA